MKEKHIVSVRTIAEYACAHGSLKAGAFLRSRLREGSAGHKRIQEKRPQGWEAEVPVSYDCVIDSVSMTIRGRADLAMIDGDRMCIAEIKTTKVDPNLIMKEDYPEHWAQAEIYAYILCEANELYEARVELIYAGANEKEKRLIRNCTIQELRERFYEYASPYADYLKAGERWAETAAPTFENLRFPFEQPREGQIDMAEAVYEAMQGNPAIIEAPTGIGKTIAALYGALRALGEGKITRVFYLTARTTGRRAAENALEMTRANGLKIRTVTVTAKEIACFKGKTECGDCPYASGYYDRCREALKESMAIERLTEETIADLARTHEICPFELSLDLTMIADVVICDYNYVFDPRIRLKRHFEKKSRAGILVDEAHNLIDRSREMYSAELSGQHARMLREKQRTVYGEGNSIDHALTDLITALTMEEAEYDALREPPINVIRAANALAELCEQLRVTDEELQDFMYECIWFCRVARMFDDSMYRAMIKPEGKDESICVKLWCFSPGRKLEQLYKHVGGAALFSATFAPIGYYARELGIYDRTRQLSLESPFPKENLLAVRLPISVRFKDRSDTMEKVVRVIECMAESHTGNYLACFPSYAYMTQAYRYYRMRYPNRTLYAQKPNMTGKDREAFLEAFKRDTEHSMVAFIVLGGVFSEGVDLPGELLSGTCIVSTGMAMPNPECDLLTQLNADVGEEGMDAAYTYPGFRKVLQAAGRVIRSETDRGIVLLVDDRYIAPKYSELFPPHWQVKTITGMSRLRTAFEAFWANK